MPMCWQDTVGVDLAAMAGAIGADAGRSADVAHTTGARTPGRFAAQQTQQHSKACLLLYGLTHNHLRNK